MGTGCPHACPSDAGNGEKGVLEGNDGETSNSAEDMRENLKETMSHHQGGVIPAIWRSLTSLRFTWCCLKDDYT